MKGRSLNRFISAITSSVLLFAVYHCFPNSIIKKNSITPSTTISASDHISAEYVDNHFNRQDDTEVPYDRTSWVQPKEWNCPAVKPKDYEGGIMLFLTRSDLSLTMQRARYSGFISV